MKKGITGRPGTIPKRARAAEAINNILGWERSWFIRSSQFDFEAARLQLFPLLSNQQCRYLTYQTIPNGKRHNETKH